MPTYVIMYFTTIKIITFYRLSEDQSLIICSYWLMAWYIANHIMLDLMIPILDSHNLSYILLKLLKTTDVFPPSLPLPSGTLGNQPNLVFWVL